MEAFTFFVRTEYISQTFTLSHTRAYIHRRPEDFKKSQVNSFSIKTLEERLEVSGDNGFSGRLLSNLVVVGTSMTGPPSRKEQLSKL
jgi:hypothetical protein